MRLNARISEVTLAEQCARADADSARAELTRVHERHQAEIDALEQRQRQLVAALQAVGAKVDPELSAAALAGVWRAAAGLLSAACSAAHFPEHLSGAQQSVKGLD